MLSKVNEFVYDLAAYKISCLAPAMH